MATKNETGDNLKDYLKLLQDNILFKGLSENEIDEILSSVHRRKKDYAAGEVIVHQGDIINHIGIILSGEATGVKYTPEGEEILVSNMGANKIFGDVLSGANGFASPVTVQAQKDCTVLFIDYNRLVFSDFPATHRVLQNMIANISHKYFSQNRRMDILMLKSVRSKILYYLEWQKQRKGGNTFTIDLDRRLLADFLGVERSALSRELSRMKSDGLIDYHKNNFVVYF